MCILVSCKKEDHPIYFQMHDGLEVTKEKALAMLIVEYTVLAKVFLDETLGKDQENIVLQREFTERMLISINKLATEFEGRSQDQTIKKLFGIN